MSFNRLEWQRAYRAANGNIHTKKYEKTVSGFLMRLYRNMLSRVSGVQKAKYHLYAGKTIDFSKEEFYTFAKASKAFNTLWQAYESSGYLQVLAPTIDRVDSSSGYSFDNIEWVTHSENSRRGSISRHKHDKATLHNS